MITPRPLTYAPLPNLPKFWLDNCPIKTYYANALALYIPPVEKFFIHSVKHFLPRITDPTLQQAIKGFIRQEANHSREYSHYVINSIEQHYPNLKTPHSFVVKLLSFLGGAKMRLGLTAAGEHFTAITSDLLLRHPEFFQGVPKEIAELWQWHSIEEIEHKAVAFDTFKAVNGGYLIRMISFFGISWVLASTFFRLYRQMMKADQQPKGFYKGVWYFLWYQPGFLRQFIKPYFDYCRFNFHPWQESKD